MQEEKLESWYKGVKHFKHLGCEVAYLDNGREAQPLVFLHGFPNSSWDWHKLWPELDKRYRLIALDFLGNGLSAKPVEHDYSVMDQADQVSRLLGNLSVEAAHFVAHSSGISVAQELLALKEIDQDPESPGLLSVSFFNGSVIPGKAPTIMEQRLIHMQGEDMTRHIDVEFMHNIFDTLSGPNCDYSSPEVELVWFQMMRNGGERTMSKLLHYIEERKEKYDRWEAAMRKTKAPMCAIIGGDDPVWGRAQVDEIKREMPLMETELLEKVGHFPYLHAPEAVINALLSFHTACLLKA